MCVCERLICSIIHGARALHTTRDRVDLRACDAQPKVWTGKVHTHSREIIEFAHSASSERKVMVRDAPDLSTQRSRSVANKREDTQCGMKPIDWPLPFILPFIISFKNSQLNV